LGPYRIHNILTNAYSIYTNSGSAGSFRAIGAPQVIFAGESQIDIAAARLGIDPVELRLKNLLRKNEELRPGLKGIDANLASGLKKLINASQWKTSAKKKAAPIGLACAVTNAGTTPSRYRWLACNQTAS
jgi:CO/xanthine dehydrogenase Mo-binding subunit